MALQVQPAPSNLYRTRNATLNTEQYYLGLQCHYLERESSLLIYSLQRVIGIARSIYFLGNHLTYCLK